MDEARAVAALVAAEVDGDGPAFVRDGSARRGHDAAGTGAAEAMLETFAQLDELLVTLGASVAPS